MHYASFDCEKILYEKGCSYIAGTDEAGRGCLAGPLVAAAVILPLDFPLHDYPLKDSKLLTQKMREKLFAIITKHALCWSTAAIEPHAIDEDGINPSNAAAIQNALAAISQKPDYVLSDALQKKLEISTPIQYIIHGDAIVASIAAASIIAKVTRDAIMREYAVNYPQYGFDTHKGYGTQLHLEKIKQYGACPIHRLSYAPLNNT